MLIEAGHDVVGLDSDLYRRCTFGDYRAIQGIHSLTKDIRDVEVSDLYGFDALLHLAALSNDPLGNLNPELTKDINYSASIHLARLAKEVGIKRFIFASSCSNYGAAGQNWVDEESDLNPITPYGDSKVRVEKDLRNLADSSFSLTFSRSSTVYGVSPRLRFDLVLNNLVAWAFTTGRVRLKSDGMAWRPIIHIEDISRAFIAMLHAPRDIIHNQTFNVGRTNENYRIRQLAEIVAEKVPGSRVEYAKGASRDKRSYRVDCSKLRFVHDVIHGTLLDSEAPVDREGSRNIGCVIIKLATRIDKQQIAVPQDVAVFDIVQRAGIRAAGNNRIVGTPGAVAPELMSELGLHLKFDQTRSNQPHGTFVRLDGNFCRLAHGRYFSPTLVQAHVMQNVVERNKLLRRVQAA